MAWSVVEVTSGGGCCFAGASSYGSSGPHLAWSRPGPWLSWLLLPLPSRIPRPLANVSFSSFSRNTDFRMASLLMAHMKQVRIASSSGFLMAGKSHVVAICRTLAASYVGVSPSFLLMVLQNLYRSLTVNCVGS